MNYYRIKNLLHPRVSYILGEVLSNDFKNPKKRWVKTAMSDGTLFHKAVNDYVIGNTPVVKPEWQQRFDETVKWLQGWDVVHTEQLVSYLNGPLRYAGTLDLILRDKATGKVVLVDLKTGGFHDQYPLQLSAYKGATEQSLGLTIDKMMLLRPYDDCVQEWYCKDYFDDWMSVLRLFYTRKHIRRGDWLDKP